MRKQTDMAICNSQYKDTILDLLRHYHTVPLTFQKTIEVFANFLMNKNTPLLLAQS